MEQAQKLNKIPADHRLVEDLYAHGEITSEAKEYALDILYPADNWGMWISRLMLTIGSALTLCGIVYFFAFNWSKISPLIKFFTIQIAMVICLIGAYFYSLKRISGQILLLSASVLVGVFMAVFGQIYQTGADAYQLFMMWSLLTLGWTVISKFAAQWVFWLVITNVFLILWWQQAALPEHDMEHMIYVVLAIFNGAALGIWEYFMSDKSRQWMQSKWVRVLLTIAALFSMLVPIVSFVVSPSKATPSIFTAAIIGFIGHGFIYTFYRYKMQDIWLLAVAMLSTCIILEAIGLKILAEMFDDLDSFMFLLMGFWTLGIFTAAVVYLRKIIDIFEVNHA